MPIRLTVPGRTALLLEHAVFDINGTLTLDGSLVAGVEEGIDRLRRDVRVHLASSDTFGTGRQVADRLGTELVRVEPPGESRAKAELVERLGADKRS